MLLGNESIAIASVHTSPSSAKPEIEDHPAVAAWMEASFNATFYMIAGDFNADGTYFDEDADWPAILGSMPSYELFVGNDLDTTIAASSNTYDRILASSFLKSDPAFVFRIQAVTWGLSWKFESGILLGQQLRLKQRKELKST